MQLRILYILTLCLPYVIYGQSSKDEKDKTRNPLDSIKVNFMYSYYEQDGLHSPVTGGIGDEELQDQGQKISVIIPINNSTKLSVLSGIDIYTSASTDNIDDQYDGDYMSRRVLVYSLDFTMKMTFYSGTSDSKVIKTINIDFNNDVGGSEILENMDITINPANADEDDNYTVNVTIT